MTMELRKAEQPTEHMKIRNHLINLIFKAGPTPVRLASSRELGERFGVTHMTVARVMKELKNDGYLVSRRGMGTFTNVQNHNVKGQSKLFGVVIGNGKYTLFDRFELSLFSCFSDAVLRQSRRNWIQNTILLSPLSDADRELTESGLDGIIWLLPVYEAVPVIRRLKSKGMPIVSVGRWIDGVSSIAIDYAALCRQVATAMLQQGRKRILLVRMQDSTQVLPQNMAIDGVREAFREAGETFQADWLVNGSREEQENFGTILAKAKPEGIIFTDCIRSYLEALEKNTVLLGDTLFFSPEWELRDDIGYSGWLGIPNLRDAAGKAVENLEKQLESQDAEMIHESIAFQIKNGSSQLTKGCE